MTEPTVLAIEISLPPAAATAHNKGHWRVKAQAIKAYRETFASLSDLMMMHRHGAIGFKVRIHHEWFLGKWPLEEKLGANCPIALKRYRPADEGNAIQALKPAIDGIVDTGILIDDRAAFVEWGDYVRHGTQKEHGGRSCVVLRLEVLTDQPVAPKPKRVKKVAA
jgi:hypothetical protein